MHLFLKEASRGDLHELVKVIFFIFQGYRFAVLTIGAPAAGINAAVGAFARSAIYQGHTVLGVKDGFKGLVENQVIIFFNLKASCWVVHNLS